MIQSWNHYVHWLLSMPELLNLGLYSSTAKVSGFQQYQLLDKRNSTVLITHNTRSFGEGHQYYQTQIARSNIAVNQMVLMFDIWQILGSKISDWRLATLREIVYGFSQSLQENTRILLNGYILPHPFTILSPSSHLLLCSELLTELVNGQRQASTLPCQTETNLRLCSLVFEL